MTEVQIYQRCYGEAFKLIYGKNRPDDNQREAYLLASGFYGFSGTPTDSSLGTTLVSAFTRSILSEGKTYVFVIESKRAWALQETKSLLRKSSNIASATLLLSRLQLETRPWRLEKEPSDWVALGFKKDDPILPEWARGKLS